MACTTLSNALASINSTGRTTLPCATTPSCKPFAKLHTVPLLLRSTKALAVFSANGSQASGGEPARRKEALQQSTGQPRNSSSLLLDSWDPFSRGGLRQMMDTMDRLFFDDMTPARARRGGSRAAGIRAPWDVTEDEERFHIRVDMPGFGKEDVKVSVEDGVLVVSGQRDPSQEDPRWAAKSYSKFNTRLAMPDNVCLDKVSAEMKNGVLFVTVPKLRPEDRKQVFDVQVS